MSEIYDGIVLGIGGFGSAVLDHLARRGLRVLGLEQFDVAHNCGSSHGETRIIRKAYFEHPSYVPLLLRSYELFRDLEADTGESLMHLCGLMIAGPGNGEAVAGARLAAGLHRLALEEVSRDEARGRFPGFRIPEGFEVVFELDAGYLDVERCVNAHAERAVSRGAVLKSNEPVREWTSGSRCVRVSTERGTYEAPFLVVTAGAWAGRMLADLRIPLRVVRKPVIWAPVRTHDYAITAGAPAFYFEMPAGAFYGFPSLDGETLKVAEHTGGEMVQDPAVVDRSLRESDVAPLDAFLSAVMPGVDPRPVRHSVCLYTLTPDHHFIVDRHPRFENVVFGAGFSGHGFKFTPVIGEALADLATRGTTSLPIDFLSLARQSLRQIEYPD